MSSRYRPDWDSRITYPSAGNDRRYPSYRVYFVNEGSLTSANEHKEVAKRRQKMLLDKLQRHRDPMFRSPRLESGWDNRAAVSVSLHNHELHASQREYFDLPRQLFSDGTHEARFSVDDKGQRHYTVNYGHTAQKGAALHQSPPRHRKQASVPPQRRLPPLNALPLPPNNGAATDRPTGASAGASAGAAAGAGAAADFKPVPPSQPKPESARPFKPSASTTAEEVKTAVKPASPKAVKAAAAAAAADTATRAAPEPVVDGCAGSAEVGAVAGCAKCAAANELSAVVERARKDWEAAVSAPAAAAINTAEPAPASPKGKSSKAASPKGVASPKGAASPKGVASPKGAAAPKAASPKAAPLKVASPKAAAAPKAASPKAVAKAASPNAKAAPAFEGCAGSAEVGAMAGCEKCTADNAHAAALEKLQKEWEAVVAAAALAPAPAPAPAAKPLSPKAAPPAAAPKAESPKAAAPPKAAPPKAAAPKPDSPKNATPAKPAAAPAEAAPASNHCNSAARRQDGWRACSKCSALFISLFHSAGTSAGQCPAGGAHDASGSDKYAVALQADATGECKSQGGWRWCGKCNSLANGAGVCSGAGAHDFTGSGEYFVCSARRHGRVGWVACRSCASLVLNARANGGGGGNKCCGPAGSHDLPVDAPAFQVAWGQEQP